MANSNINDFLAKFEQVKQDYFLTISTVRNLYTPPSQCLLFKGALLPGLKDEFDFIRLQLEAFESAISLKDPEFLKLSRNISSVYVSNFTQLSDKLIMINKDISDSYSLMRDGKKYAKKLGLYAQCFYKYQNDDPRLIKSCFGIKDGQIISPEDSSNAESFEIPSFVSEQISIMRSDYNQLCDYIENFNKSADDMNDQLSQLDEQLRSIKTKYEQLCQELNPTPPQSAKNNFALSLFLNNLWTKSTLFILSMVGIIAVYLAFIGSSDKAYETAATGILSFIGSIIGGVFTYLGVLITIRNTENNREKAKQEKKSIIVFNLVKQLILYNEQATRLFAELSIDMYSISTCDELIRSKNQAKDDLFVLLSNLRLECNSAPCRLKEIKLSSQLIYVAARIYVTKWIAIFDQELHIFESIKNIIICLDSLGKPDLSEFAIQVLNVTRDQNRLSPKLVGLYESLLTLIQEVQQLLSCRTQYGYPSTKFTQVMGLCENIDLLLKAIEQNFDKRLLKFKQQFDLIVEINANFCRFKTISLNNFILIKDNFFNVQLIQSLQDTAELYKANMQ